MFRKIWSRIFRLDLLRIFGFKVESVCQFSFRKAPKTRKIKHLLGHLWGTGLIQCTLSSSLLSLCDRCSGNGVWFVHFRLVLSVRWLSSIYLLCFHWKRRQIKRDNGGSIRPRLWAQTAWLCPVWSWLVELMNMLSEYCSTRWMVYVQEERRATKRNEGRPRGIKMWKIDRVETRETRWLWVVKIRADLSCLQFSRFFH